LIYLAIIHDNSWQVPFEAVPTRVHYGTKMMVMKKMMKKMMRKKAQKQSAFDETSTRRRRRAQ
jgi:hypothetical protein